MTLEEAKTAIGAPISYFAIGVPEAQERLNAVCPDGYRAVVCVFSNCTDRADDLVTLGHAARIGSVKVRSGATDFPIYLCDADAWKRPPGRPAAVQGGKTRRLYAGDDDWQWLVNLGDGEPSAGLRKARIALNNAS